MLADEGQYSDECTTGKEHWGPSGMCPEQAARFSSIFGTATFLVNAISLPSGLFLDKCGGRAMSAAAALFTFSGLVVLGLADTMQGRDWFVVGYSFLSVGGQMTLFSVFPTAFLVPEFQTLVFATNSCLFDGR